MLKQWLHGLKGHNTYISKNSQSTNVQEQIPPDVWASFRELRVLRILEEDKRTSVRRITATGNIGVPLPGEFANNNHFTYTTSS